MMAIENHTRIIQARGTKADVEAFSASLEEGAIAYSTNTGEIGIYTNGVWVWKGGPAGKYRQFVYVVTAGAFSFVIDDDGKPVMALQELE